jgi:hypothetical protein
LTTTVQNKTVIKVGWENETVLWTGERFPTQSFVVSSLTDFVTKGDNYADWKHRLKSGLQCTTTMSGVLYTHDKKDAFFVGRMVPNNDQILNLGSSAKSNTGAVRGINFSIGPFLDRTSMDTANTLALQAFVKRLRATQTQFQGMVFLGEIPQTLRMLVSPMKSLRQGLGNYVRSLSKRKRQVRRVSPKKRLSVAKKILSDTWLEYSFGWKPLISDIDDAAHLLARQMNDSQEPKWRPVNAESENSNRDGTIGDATTQSLMKVRFTAYSEATSYVKYRGCVSLENPTQRGWLHAGFDPSDFLPTVWELIPYSFLADYFVNLDDIISAATYNRSRLRWASKLTRNVLITNCKGYQALPLNFVVGHVECRVSSGFDVKTRVEFSRAPYNGSLVPDLKFSIPGFGTKWVNMAALLASTRKLVPFHR